MNIAPLVLIAGLVLGTLLLWLALWFWAEVIENRSPLPRGLARGMSGDPSDNSGNHSRNSACRGSSD